MKILSYKNIYLLTALVLLSLGGRAQTTGEWVGAKIHFDLPKKFSCLITGDERFFNDSIGLYKTLFQFEGGYKISRRFDVALIYRTAWRREKDGNFHYRNKLMAEFDADFPLSRFKIENRFRYERKTKTYIRHSSDEIPQHHLRDKVMMRYNIKNSKITPDIFSELFFRLNNDGTPLVDKFRLGTDVKYDISKKHSVKGGLMLQKGSFYLPFNTLWFRCSYTYNLKI